MKTKKEYLNAIVEDFNGEWKQLQQCLKKPVSTDYPEITYGSIIRRIEKICGNADFHSEFSTLAYNTVLYHNCIRGPEHLAVHQWNHYLYELWWQFEDDGEVSLVKTEGVTKDGTITVNDYLALTVPRCLDCDYLEEIMKRGIAGSCFFQMKSIRSTSLNLGDFAAILDAISDNCNYTLSKGAEGCGNECYPIFNNKVYEDILGRNGSTEVPFQ